MRQIERIILHCSATSKPNYGAAECRAFHMGKPPQGRGFIDIGYHFFIRTSGIIELGRPIEQVGAHCEGYNKTSIGICLNGLKLEDFQEVQFKALEHLLSTIKPMFPKATIHPHSDLEVHGKLCPVFGVYRFRKLWDELESSPHA